MKMATLRNIPLYTRTLLLSPKSKTILNPFISPLRSRLPLYSSDSQFSSDANIARSQKQNDSNDDVEGVSDEELKRRIGKLYEGDDDAIPSIFEAILKRKLAGISGDDKILKELRRDSPNEDLKDEDFDYDSESDDDKPR